MYHQEIVEFLGSVKQQINSLACSKLLQALRFSSMHQRYEAIPEAHTKTFEWIFREDAGIQWQSYRDWLRHGQGVYWAQGKAGSGKSTLMRFLAEDPRSLKLLQEWSGALTPEICQFYFWRSGVVTQRSLMGLLRSLVYEILTLKSLDYESLIPKIFETEWKEITTRADWAIDPDGWRISRMKRAFSDLLQLTNSKSRICIFIDGLDEYDGDHGEIATFFRQLSSDHSCVKFCVSSRPWPVFDDILELSPGLKLQDLTHDDIKLFVNDKLAANKRMLQLLKDSPQSSSSFVDEIVERACGVFLWVTLVVKSLMDGLRNCDDIIRLRKRFEALPNDLEALYAHMLQSIDPFYQEDAAVIFQLMRCSVNYPCVDWPFNISSLDRALSGDFQSAMAAPTASSDESDESYVGQLESRARHMRLETFMKSCCMGLIEVTRVSPAKKPFNRGHRQVGRNTEFSDPEDKQLPGIISYLHASVKDFLGKPETWAIIQENASKRMAPELSILISQILLLKERQIQQPIQGIRDHVITMARLLGQKASDCWVPLLNEFERVINIQSQNYEPSIPHDNLDISSKNEPRARSPGWITAPAQVSWLHSPKYEPPLFCDWCPRFATKFAKETDPSIFHGRTLLPLAVENNLYCYVDDKLASDASVSKQCSTPLLALGLQWHAWQGELNDRAPEPEVLRVLLNHDANPNGMLRDHTIWQWAIHYVQIMHSAGSLGHLAKWFRTFWLLLKHGADPNIRCFERGGPCTNRACNVHSERLVWCPPYGRIADHSCLDHPEGRSLEDLITDVFGKQRLQKAHELHQLVEEMKKEKAPQLAREAADVRDSKKRKRHGGKNRGRKKNRPNA